MRDYPLIRTTLILLVTCVTSNAQTTGNTTAKPASSAAASTAAASASGTGAAPVAKKVNVKFVTVAMQSPVQGMQFKSTAGMVPFSATPSQSKAYSYTGPSTMEIFATGGSTTPVGAVTFPRDGNYILYMFGDTKNGVGGAAVSNDARSFPIGSVRYINGTNIPLALEVNGKNSPLKPGEVLVQTFKGGAEDFITIRLRRTDKTDQDPLGEIDMNTRMAPPNPKQRDNEFIIIGNPMEVQKDGAAPNFNMVQHLDDPAANGGGPGQGRRGSGNGG